MDNTNNPQPPSMPPTSPKPDSQAGGIIGIIIILVVLVLGGLYLWGARLKSEETADTADTNGQTAQEVLNASDPATDNLGTQGTSDELGAIEDDLNTTSLNGLDTEVNNINVELQ